MEAAVQFDSAAAGRVIAWWASSLRWWAGWRWPGSGIARFCMCAG